MDQLDRLILAVYNLRDHHYRIRTTDGTAHVDREAYYNLIRTLKEIDAERGIDSSMLGYKERLAMLEATKGSD